MLEAKAVNNQRAEERLPSSAETKPTSLNAITSVAFCSTPNACLKAAASCASLMLAHGRARLEDCGWSREKRCGDRGESCQA